MSIKKMQKDLESVLKDYTMIGYHFEAISSILNYPDEYELGKKSAYAKTCMYGHRIKSLEDMRFWEESGECPICFMWNETMSDYFDGYEDQE